MMDQLRITGRLRVGVLISVCFLLASKGWLSWLYRIMGLAAPASVDLLTMVFGYLVQAVGTAVFMLAGQGSDSRRERRMAVVALALYPVCLAPATLTASLAATLAFGYLANMLCGIVQGFYLCCLAGQVDEGSRGLVFGTAYAASTVGTWVVSLVGGGVLTRGLPCLVLCCLLAGAAVVLAKTEPPFADAPRACEPLVGRGVPAAEGALLACASVAMVSVVKTVGFSFPTTDLVSGVNLELSRVLYGAGLALAGIVADRDRRYALLCCVASLAMPFLMQALSGAGASGVLLWSLGYLLTGFFTVFRVLLLGDVAATDGRVLLAGAGLLFGRLGDALGTALCLALSPKPLALITVASMLFVAAMAALFLLYQQRFAAEPAAPPSEREVFERFAARHDLSAREREVLRLVLAERTNAEIAAALFVSEATVKFHVRNLLRKTGCKSRLDVVTKYATGE